MSRATRTNREPPTDSFLREAPPHASMPSRTVRFGASTLALAMALVVLALLFTPDPTGLVAMAAAGAAGGVAVGANYYRYYGR